MAFQEHQAHLVMLSRDQKEIVEIVTALAAQVTVVYCTNTRISPFEL